MRKHLYVITIFAICHVLLAGLQAGAATLERHVELPRPVISSEGSKSTVSIPGLAVVGRPGEPLLPVYGMRVLLPQGEKITAVSVDAPWEQEISLDMPAEWAQPQAPLSEVGPHEWAPAARDIYMSDRPFPAERAIHITTETFRGYNIAFLRIYPVTYLGSRQSILYAPRMDILIETAPAAGMLRRSAATFRAGSPEDVRAIERLVDDTSAASSYVEHERFHILG